MDEANAKGGVDGRKVILAEGDDESTPDAGRRVAEKLSREGHNLIIGPITSSISLAISQNLARWDAAVTTVLASPASRGAKKLPETYFTPASTFPFFSGSLGGAGSTLKP